MSFKESLADVTNLYKLDQSQWEERVSKLGSEDFLKELNKNRKMLNINGSLNRVEVLGEVAGFVICGLSGLREPTFGFAGAIIASTLLIHGRPSVVLTNRVSFLKSEANSRVEQAILYQDIETLNVLEPISPTNIT